ncbi:uncharacterized protein LOC144446773 [Glandiceps talaboti]
MTSSLAASRRELPRDVLMSKCATREMNINNSVEQMRFRRASRNIEKELRSQEHYLCQAQRNYMRRNFELLRRQRLGNFKTEQFNANNNHGYTDVVDLRAPIPTVVKACTNDCDVSSCDQKQVKPEIPSHSLNSPAIVNKSRTTTEQHKNKTDFTESVKIVVRPSSSDFQNIKCDKDCRPLGGITASTISSSQKAAYSQGLISKDREAELLSALVITPLKTHIPVVERETKTETQLKLQEFLDRASMAAKPVTPLSYKEEKQRRFSRVYGPERPTPTKLVTVTPRSSFSDIVEQEDDPLVLPPVILPAIHECEARQLRPRSWHYIDRSKMEEGVSDEEWEQLKRCRYLRINQMTSNQKEHRGSFETIYSE